MEGYEKNKIRKLKAPIKRESFSVEFAIKQYRKKVIKKKIIQLSFYVSVFLIMFLGISSGIFDFGKVLNKYYLASLYGESCTSNEECETQFCNSQNVCTNKATGDSCGLEGDCNTGYCNSGSCQLAPNGVSCSAGENCVSGICGTNGLCGGASGYSGCSSSDQCQSGLTCNSNFYCTDKSDGSNCGVSDDCISTYCNTSSHVCSTYDCSTENWCGGNGTCTDVHTCSCYNNGGNGHWSGASCSECATGWSGSNCLTPSCAGVNNCSGHGTCASANTCTCNVGWSGEICNTPLCTNVNNCLSHGTCSAVDTCTCNSGYYGFNCSNNSYVNLNINTTGFSGQHYSFVNFDDSLVGWWRGEDNTNDESGNDRNGTWVGTPNYTSGKFGRAFTFDGSNAVDVGDIDFPYDQFSVSIWARTTYGGDYNQYREMISKIRYQIGQGDPWETGEFAINIGDMPDHAGNYVMAMGWRYGGGLYAVSSGTNGFNMRDGNWHHIVVTHSSASEAMYVDGVLRDSIVVTDSMPQTDYHIFIGGSNWHYYHTRWIGDVDDVMIFNRVISPREAYSLYNAQSDQYSTIFGVAGETNHSVFAYAVDTSANKYSDNETAVAPATTNILLGPLPDGNTCSFSNQCQSQFCNSRGICANKSLGSNCGAPDDCNSGYCNTHINICKADGSIGSGCGADSDCFDSICGSNYTCGNVPVITLIGSPKVIIYQDQTYTDAGAMAQDVTDGNITANIVKVSDVDTSVPGTYSVTYNVKNSSDISAQEVSRVVEVQAITTTKTVIDTTQDNNIYIPETVAEPTLDISSITPVTEGLNVKVTVPNDIIVTSDTSVGAVTMDMPAGVVITASASQWNGVINLPQAVDNATVTASAGSTAMVISAIEMGLSGDLITFNKAVRILFAGGKNRLIGYSRNNVFTEITSVCSADTQTAGDALADNSDCKINSGEDLVVWTKHFTTFITYIETLDRNGGGAANYNPLPSSKSNDQIHLTEIMRIIESLKDIPPAEPRDVSKSIENKPIAIAAPLKTTVKGKILAEVFDRLVSDGKIDYTIQVINHLDRPLAENSFILRNKVLSMNLKIRSLYSWSITDNNVNPQKTLDQIYQEARAAFINIFESIIP